MMKTQHQILAGVAVAAAVGVGWSRSDANLLGRAQQFYASRPVFERPVTLVEAIPKGLTDVRAQSCGTCHQAIYQEWAISTHRRAWTQDAQFQEELKKSRGSKDKPSDVAWMCVNCHTPLVNQLERVVVGLRDGGVDQPVYADNPSYDALLQDEAITCATCHVRDGTVLGPYGNTNAPHATRLDPSLTTSETCTRCHQAEARFPDINLGCFFSTGREWSEGPFAAASCQSCHMPEVQRKTTENADVPIRKTRRHWFGGSLIPKHPGFAADLAPLRAVYGSAVDLSVEGTFSVGANAPWPAANPPVNADALGATCGHKEGCVVARVVVRNTRAGHNFPTGDPERHAIITADVLDEKGRILGSAQDTMGSKYQWWPDIRLLTDTRIKPGGQREFWVVAPGAARNLTVRLRGEKFRMYADAFEHHKLEGRAERGRVFSTSTWSLGPGNTSRLLTRSDDLGTVP